MTAQEPSPRITPFLWFDNNAREAVDFYLSVFPNSRRLGSLANPPGTPGPNFLTISFELEGQQFTALNGGPMFNFTEAVSFVVRCDTQDEIDNRWSQLSAGGTESRCGWLKDRFGLSWQIVPARLPELLSHPGAIEAMMKMSKLNIQQLQDAANR